MGLKHISIIIKNKVMLRRERARQERDKLFQSCGTLKHTNPLHTPKPTYTYTYTYSYPTQYTKRLAFSCITYTYIYIHTCTKHLAFSSAYKTYYPTILALPSFRVQCFIFFCSRISTKLSYSTLYRTWELL